VSDGKQTIRPLRVGMAQGAKESSQGSVVGLAIGRLDTNEAWGIHTYTHTGVSGARAKTPLLRMRVPNG